MRKPFVLFLVLTSFIACKNPSQTSDETQDKVESESISELQSLSTAETIAYKSGFELWDSVEELQFTFNVDRGEKHFERSFIWYPKTKDVIYMNQTDTISYNRNNLDSLSILADKAFINDKYWLLAPFQLLWDRDLQFTEMADEIAPISKDTLDKLTVVYPKTGGYTPGDAYDFYYDDEFIVREWAFRESNDSLPQMINTWEAYMDFNGLKLATIHRDSTANFKLYFTNIQVK